MQSSKTVLMLTGMAVFAANTVAAQPASQSSEASSAIQSSPTVSHTTSIAAFFSRGNYGDEFADSDTRIRYLPIAHEIKRGSWRYKATIPALQISGPANVLVNLGSVGGLGNRAEAGGLGDIVLNATYELPPLGESLPFVDLGVEVKLPTADADRGLGTGRVDAGIQLDAFQVIKGNTVFGTLGYKYRKPSPVYPEIRNAWIASLGIGRAVNDAWQVGVIYDYRQAVSSLTGETHELLPYVSVSVSERLQLMAYVIHGFTEDSPDRAIGVQMSVRW